MGVTLAIPLLQSPANRVQSRRRGMSLNVGDTPYRHRTETPHRLFLNATKAGQLTPALCVGSAATCHLPKDR